jgi:hypothetical protein
MTFIECSTLTRWSRGGKLLSVKRVANLSAGGLPFRSEHPLGREVMRNVEEEASLQASHVRHVPPLEARVDTSLV